MQEDEIKELNINGVVYAKYWIRELPKHGDIIHLKVITNIVPNSITESEDYLIQIIGLIEKRSFKGASFLNV